MIFYLFLSYKFSKCVRSIYHILLVRHLTKLLSLLRKSKYTIESKKHFMEKIKQETISDGYEMVSSDVK